MTRIIVSGGGTAGHVTPLLAVASELKQRHPDVHIRYIGNVGDRFADIVKSSDDIESTRQIVAGKLRRFHGLKAQAYLKEPLLILRNIRDIFYFSIGFLQSLWILTWWRPSVILIKGGYVCLPVGLAAAILRIPMVTHDSDAVAGLTNRILSKYARYNAVAMPMQNYKYPKHKIRHTGLPLPAEIVKVTPQAKKEARIQLGIDHDAYVVAVVGGSLGAVRLNNAIVSQAHDLLSKYSKLWLIHVAGMQQFKEIDTFYSGLPEPESKRVLRCSFSSELLTLTAASDLVVSRAGSSIFEFAAQQLPVVLVPNPLLTGGHQLLNAHALQAINAAEVITEQELVNTNNTVLTDTITRLMHDNPACAALAKALHDGLTVPDSTKRIVDVLEEAAT